MINSFIVSTLVLGAVYCLVVLGLVLLFRATKVISFTQGGLMALGAFIFYSLFAHQPLLAALAESMAAVGLLGGLLYYLVLRRLAGSEHFVVVIATMGINVLITTVILAVWGPDPRYLPAEAPIKVLGGGIVFTATDVLIVVLAAGLIAVLMLTLQQTMTGLRMRAVADNPLLSALFGVNIDWIATLAWAVSAATAAAAGVSLGLFQVFDPVQIPAAGFVAFPAMLLGGLDSIRGALVGGLLLALIQNVVTLLVGGRWSLIGVYAVLLLVLLVRPSGIFGSKSLVRV